MSLEKKTEVSTTVDLGSVDVEDADAVSGLVSSEVADVFVAVAWQVWIGWFVGCFVLFASQMLAILIGDGYLVSSDQLIWVSFASGLISLASLVPGLVIGRSVSVERVVQSGVAIVSTTSALGIRFAGTVALFVACRYHFGEESLSIVFLVIGWYVFLTSIEVHGLARGLTSMDQVADFDRRDS